MSDKRWIVTAAIAAMRLAPEACWQGGIEPWLSHPSADDICIRPLRAWLRPDGSLIYFELGLNPCAPNWWERLRLRRAIRRWKKAVRHAGY